MSFFACCRPPALVSVAQEMLKDPTLSAYFRVLGFEIDDDTWLWKLPVFMWLSTTCFLHDLAVLPVDLCLHLSNQGSSLYQFIGQGQGR